VISCPTDLRGWVGMEAKWCGDKWGWIQMLARACVDGLKLPGLGGDETEIRSPCRSLVFVIYDILHDMI